MLEKLKARHNEYLKSRFHSWTGLNSADIDVYRSNRLLVFVAISGLAVLALYGYNFHPQIANLLSDGFLFFHFPKIFNLKIPEPTFFEKIAQYSLIIVIGFHWISIELILLEYFFSSLTISRKERIIIYIQSNLFGRRIHILKEKKIQYELSDTLITRIFGIGSLTLHSGNESWKIRSISRARIALNEIISFNKK